MERQYLATILHPFLCAFARHALLPFLVLLLFFPLTGCAPMLAVPIAPAFAPRSLVETRTSLAHSDSSAPSIPQIVTSGVMVSSHDMTIGNSPQHLSLLDVDLTNPNVRLGVVQAHQRLFSSGETLSSMGQRTNAVAGINGDFFEIYGSGAPLGMLQVQGKIMQSPSSFAVLGITSSGRLTIGPEAFSAKVSTLHGSYTLHSINRYGDVNGDHLVLFTPALGASILLNGASIAILKPVHGSTHVFTVLCIQENRNSLPILSGASALIGSGAAARWLSHLQIGETLNISEHLAPDSNLVKAIGGGPQLIKNGAIYHDPFVPAPSEATQENPLTALGISRDGLHALLVVCNGHQADASLSKGLTYAQMAHYLLTHGAYQAMLFDSGGSSELVARLPGKPGLSVINSPSDGYERPVANGLFIYSTEKVPGPATAVVVNNNQALTLLPGTNIRLSAYALDALHNPASDPLQFSVIPGSLATIERGMLRVKARSGHGLLQARAGHASTTIQLNVVEHLAALRITPSMPDLMSGQRIQFQLTGLADNNAVVPIPGDMGRWHIIPARLGTMQANGLFTASSSVVGTGSLSASVYGLQVSASIAVGDLAGTVSSMTDLDQWGVSDHYLNVYPRNVPIPGPHVVSTGSMVLNSQVKRAPEDAGTMDLWYHFRPDQHVSHLDPYPDDPNRFQIPLRCGQQAPAAVGFWIKAATAQNKYRGGPFDPGVLNLSIGFYEADNTPISFHLGILTSSDWIFIPARLPQGLDYPLRVNYISIVVINPPKSETGHLYLSTLQALYAPRPLHCAQPAFLSGTEST
ncbi:phosphodiester glycosidase family protein [Ktedonosporobacter rubrisoli]|uniref:phosphodiester glycosidase family protein n=1 Tax=Ktedonosporobacter rubrisoli TaxID=2509675 RepID=UPI0013EEB133|nr:phosphodiester glycosidase family protein [Ktedonosporobacter rubrisoli]